MNKVSESKVVKSEDEWRAELSAEEYEITRCSATERAFSGLYWDTKTPGIYNCKCCHTPLFDSNTKYDSGTGWPSFYQPISSDVVATRDDLSYGMRRIEVVCATCDAHLGHLFPDGPNPTGLRFCMNSASLDLDPRET
jgi:peptide-methionine (R)-S-oxide reductase